VTNELQQNRYDRLLRRVGGIIGPGSKVNEVLTELFPVLDVETMPDELLILSGTNTAWGGGTIQSIAGQAPKMGLFNPAGSNAIVTLTDVLFSSQAGTVTVRWGKNTNELTTVISTGIFGDTRNPFNQLPIARIGQQSAVALANATGQGRLGNNTILHLEAKNSLAILRPGIGFEIGIPDFAAVIFVTFYWRERTMEPSERLADG